MSILVVGATGATGKLVVEQLIDKGEEVRIVARSEQRLTTTIKHFPNVTITIASLLDLSDQQLITLVKGCKAVVCCLGHNLSFKGIYGQPRWLVSKAVQRLCSAIEQTASRVYKPVKFILMSTTGYQNIEQGETTPLSQKMAIKLIRLLVPPHIDNEKAADFLMARYTSSQRLIEWVAIRPDTLVDTPKDFLYDIYESPVRNPIFDAGTTSRANVAHFMMQLILQTELWDTWKMSMPVIYNRAQA